MFITFPICTHAQTNLADFDDIVLRATAAHEQKDVPTAIKLYTQATQLRPKWADGWWFLGSLQYEAGSFSAARDALSHYIELTPDAGPALAMRGLCEFELGEYGESLKDIQHGLSLGAANQPRNEEILRYHEALLLTRDGKFEEALRSYAFFTRDKTANRELLIGIGLAGLRTPLLPKDIKAGEQEMFAAAGNAAFHFMTGDQKGAQEVFRDFFQRFPTTANAHYLYGYLEFATDPDQAIAEFKRELEISSSSAPAHVMLAWASLMRNSSSDALPLAEMAVKEEPALPSAQLVLGRALAETGNLKVGIEHLEKALQLEPDNLETHLALAKAYSNSGRKKDARRERLVSLQIAKGDTTQIARP